MILAHDWSASACRRLNSNRGSEGRSHKKRLLWSLHRGYRYRRWQLAKPFVCRKPPPCHRKPIGRLFHIKTQQIASGLINRPPFRGEEGGPRKARKAVVMSGPKTVKHSPGRTWGRCRYRLGRWLSSLAGHPWYRILFEVGHRERELNHKHCGCQFGPSGERFLWQCSKFW